MHVSSVAYWNITEEMINALTQEEIDATLASYTEDDLTNPLIGMYTVVRVCLACCETHFDMFVWHVTLPPILVDTDAYDDLTNPACYETHVWLLWHARLAFYFAAYLSWHRRRT